MFVIIFLCCIVNMVHEVLVWMQSWQYKLVPVSFATPFQNESNRNISMTSALVIMQLFLETGLVAGCTSGKMNELDKNSLDSE